jgi:glycosyltransferase involved in cell wall biosynthesis
MNEQEKYDWMVCVSCMTFNHAPYIVDAMNGFTMQETDFPFVCAIVDDASTDDEQEVIKNYLNENFDVEDKMVVRQEETDDYVLIFSRHKTNLNCYFAVFYLKYNHYRKKAKAPYLARWRDKAKYIALCEGDDYWIAPDKLQKQVDIMESHPDFALSYGVARQYMEISGKFKGVVGGYINGFNSLLIKGNCIPTLTTFYRSKHSKEYWELEKPDGWKMGDYPLWLFLSTKGKIYYDPQKIAVYRVLQSSASHFTNYQSHENFEDSIYNIQKFFAEYQGVDDRIKEKLKQEHYKRLFRIAYEHHAKEDAQKWFKFVEYKDLKMWIKKILLCL